MDDLRVEVTGKGANRRVKVIGSPDAFLWLQTASNNASSGFSGNEAALSDGGVLEVAPASPRPDQQPRSRSLHTKRA